MTTCSWTLYFVYCHLSPHLKLILFNLTVYLIHGFQDDRDINTRYIFHLGFFILLIFPAYLLKILFPVIFTSWHDWEWNVIVKFNNLKNCLIAAVKTIQQPFKFEFRFILFVSTWVSEFCRNRSYNTYSLYFNGRYYV